MRTNFKNRSAALFTLAFLATLHFQDPAFAQGAAFTYQGRLQDGTNPANGHYDLQFILFNASQSGSPVGLILTNADVSVNSGLFIATLNFGAAIFTGSNYWLEIGVRTNATVGFTTLVPRQPITPAPYAVFAENVGSGGLAAGAYGNAMTFNNAGNSFSGTFTGNGAGVTNVNAASLGGLRSSNFWKLGGNAAINPTNDFLGTSDNQPLEFRVEGRRALRLESATNAARGYGPNVIGGYEGNSIAPGVVGATIAGGGRLDPGADLSHRITAHHGTIGGGDRNTVEGEDSTIAGGGGNVVSASYSSIGGGLFNFINTNASYAACDTIGGGYNNVVKIGAIFATIGGGYNNTIETNALHAAVSGGLQNQIGGTTRPQLSIGFGWANGISAGAGNYIGQNAAGSFIGGGQNNAIETNITWAAIGGGLANTIGPGSFRFATIGGGFQNQIGGSRSNVSGFFGDGNAIAGGAGNYIGSNAVGCLVGGGHNNFIETNLTWAAIGGGLFNSIGSAASYGTVAGGYFNQIVQAANATIGGGQANVIGTNASSSVISGGENNAIQLNCHDSVIAGGAYNSMQSTAFHSAISGGLGNTIKNFSFASAIGGGLSNSVEAYLGAIGGGQANVINGYGTTVSGGMRNGAIGDYSCVSGGTNNLSRGVCSTIAGGSGNFIALNGAGAFAVGRNCFVQHPGAFMWSDGTLPFETVVANSFNALASGGYYLYTASGVGVQVAAGGNAWSAISDRNVKENFRPVDCQAVLDKVVAMPLTTWNLKTQSPEIRHIGVMAQDFKAAFAIGEDDRHISTSDADGVAMAAIKALNQNVDDLKTELKRRDAENAQLKQRLETLEKLFAARNSN